MKWIALRNGSMKVVILMVARQESFFRHGDCTVCDALFVHTHVLCVAPFSTYSCNSCPVDFLELVPWNVYRVLDIPLESGKTATVSKFNVLYTLFAYCHEVKFKGSK